MLRFFIFILIPFLLFACNNKKESNTTKVVENPNVDTKPVEEPPKTYTEFYMNGRLIRDGKIVYDEPTKKEEKADPKPARQWTEIEKKGMGYLMKAKKKLEAQLFSKLDQEGVIESMKYCNLSSTDLLSSIGSDKKIKISRVSNKPRNLANNVDPMERMFQEKYEQFKGVNADLNPIVSNKGSKSIFYYPIITSAKCLSCHGIVKDNIKPDVQELIKKLYPYDKAYGYYADEIRGMWKIEMPNQK